MRTRAFVGKVGVGFFIGAQRPVVHVQVEGVKIGCCRGRAAP